jgi:hypothetical protein
LSGKGEQLLLRMGDPKLPYAGLPTFNVQAYLLQELRSAGLCRCEHMPGAYSPVDRLTPLGIELRDYLRAEKGRAVMAHLDYPVAAPDGVEPIIFRSQIIQAMVVRYRCAVPDLSFQEALEAALATWWTNWPTDPAPRTLEAAAEEVDGDLPYWGED